MHLSAAPCPLAWFTFPVMDTSNSQFISQMGRRAAWLGALPIPSNIKGVKHPWISCPHQPPYTATAGFWGGQEVTGAKQQGQNHASHWAGEPAQHRIRLVSDTWEKLDSSYGSDLSHTSVLGSAIFGSTFTLNCIRTICTRNCLSTFSPPRPLIVLSSQSPLFLLLGSTQPIQSAPHL